MHIDEGKCTGREEMEDAIVTSQLGSGSTPLFSALAISRQIRVPHPHKDGAGTYGYSPPSTHPQGAHIAIHKKCVLHTKQQPGCSLR